MGKRLYVGNLPFSYTSANLQDLFGAHGAVTSAQVVMDRVTNRSRGFGFVEFATAEAADKAIAELNGKPIEGRSLTVNEARERTPGGGGGGGGGFGRGPRGPGGGGGRFDRGPRY
jgi:RNA recognition motif-containing protein